MLSLRRVSGLSVLGVLATFEPRRGALGRYLQQIRCHVDEALHCVLSVNCSWTVILFHVLRILILWVSRQECVGFPYSPISELNRVIFDVNTFPRNGIDLANAFADSRSTSLNPFSRSASFERNSGLISSSCG